MATKPDFVMNFLAVSGSLRANSINTSILRAAAQLAPSTVTVVLYDGLDDLPHFSPERDTASPPLSVGRLRTMLREADAVLICTPEYIHGMPGVLKNMLDWVSSSGEFVGKPVGVISAGPSDMGGSRAHTLLSHTMDVLMARSSEETSLIVPFVRTRINTDGQIIDPVLEEELRRVMEALADIL